MRAQQHFWLGALVLAVLTIPGRALAWDDWKSWYRSADGMEPGGGGIVGTGGTNDYRITCANCHVESKGKLAATLEFSPALTTVGTADTYAPGTTYQVTVKLVQEVLGLSACEQYTKNSNGFAATFEDDAGRLAGTLTSDSGQSSGNCPKTFASDPVGTTFLMANCNTVISLKQEATTSWSFAWKAPSAGSGEVTVYYAAVDGNCDMSSMNDDVKVTNFKISEAVTRNDSRFNKMGGRRALAMLGMLPIAAVVIGRRRRRDIPT